MTLSKISSIALILVLTICSGLADSQGFVHAANVWDGGKIVWIEIFKSALGFFGGILLYWVAIKFVQEVRIASPEIQTLGWFSVTIVGVAVSTGKFWQWQIIDKLIGICVLLGMCWLLLRIKA
ncbi:MAG TPA: hypothetical protein VFA41_21975 [Ktedonobacteraceae bacterium]|jgi:divalent metal cation (Fe/Co/Zn/Cd) transporter|nr:hypothetical protein [Ktedonobacteraceae bacterium]